MSQTKAQLISDLVQALNFTGTATAPANGLFLSAANTLKLATASTERLKIDGTEVVVNDTGASVDFRVEGDAETHLLFVDASAEKIGIGSDSPNARLVIYRKTTQANNPVLEVRSNHDTTNSIKFSIDGDGEAYFSDRVGIGTTSPHANLHIQGGNTSSTPAEVNIWGGTLGRSKFNLVATETETTTGTFQLTTESTVPSIQQLITVQNNGKVGIGTTSPEETLDLGNTTQMNLKIGGRGYIGQAYSTAATIIGHSVKAKTTGTISGGMIVTETNSGGGAPSALRMQSGNIEFHTAASGTQDADFNSNERMRIDSSGRLLLGHSSSIAAASGSVAFSLQVVGTNFGTTTLNGQRYEDGTSGASILLNHSRGSVGNHTILHSNDELGKIRFYGSDGNDFENYGAEITALVDGSPGDNVMPGRLVFKTTTTGSPTPSERMRIDSQGRVKIHGVGATISNHALGTTHTPLYLQTVTDLTAVNTAEGSASTGLFRMFDVSTSSDRYHGIELRNKNNGDIRILNQDRNTSDKGDLVIVMPKSDGVASGLSEKIRISGLYDSVNIAGKGGATLKGPSDSGYNIQKTDVYIATKTEVTAVNTQAGDAVAGLIRFEDTGSSNNRFHGIELRNKNSGDIRILNKDVGASNKADMVFATDNGSDVTEVARFLNSGGLTFGGSTSSEHALKDYEEGTFTPGLAFSGGSTGVAYSSRSASFIKIGTMVYCQIQMDLTSKGSSTGNAEITGLPFTVGNYVSGTGQEGTGFITWWANYSSSNSETVFWVNEGNTIAQIYNAKPATNISQQTESSWENNTQMRAFVIFRST